MNLLRLLWRCFWYWFWLNFQGGKRVEENCKFLSRSILHVRGLASKNARNVLLLRMETVKARETGYGKEVSLVSLGREMEWWKSEMDELQQMCPDLFPEKEGPDDDEEEDATRGG